MSKHGKPIGPLHGVPMTLKDQFNVRGHDTTLGYTSRAFKPASDDSVLVRMLRKLGAVIIAKTNLPQSIMVCTRHVVEPGPCMPPCFLTNSVVRDGEPNMGAHHKPHESKIYARRLDGRRVCIAVHERQLHGLGNRYWWQYPHPRAYDGTIWVETKCKLHVLLSRS